MDLQRGGRRRPVWWDWSDERLLDLPMNRLGLHIEGTALEDRIRQLYEELKARKLRFRPHFWLAEEWFTPDGVPGTGAPFYLAHPRLMRLERRQMLEVEGGPREECMRILRHEAGHAIDNAFRLRRRRARQRVFGRSTLRYPDYYRPRPYSKRFVQHLRNWYAQSHPDEDFAETFAVWLRPRSPWARRYQGWPALKKLEYMDALMRELAGKRPEVTTHERLEPLSEIRKTLREHYQSKRERYTMSYPDFYDAELRRLFADGQQYPGREPAATFLRRIRGEVRRMVSKWTGQHQYTLDTVFDEIIGRAAELRLRRIGSERQVKLDFAILLTVQTMNYVYSGRHCIAM